MIFITNRMRAGSPALRPGSVFKFDMRYNTPSTSVYFCRRMGEGNYEEVGSVNVFEELSGCAEENILLFIHGFNVLPDAAFAQAIHLQGLFDKVKPNQTLVVPMIWPCDDDAGIAEDYWDDQMSARESAFGFARILGKFLGWQQERVGDICTKRLQMLVHSMGALVLRGALYVWQGEFGTAGVPMVFRNVFIAAGDDLNTILEREEVGRYICHSARNVVVYHAADDIAMNASKVANVADRSRRLGHTGPAEWDKVPRNVYALDCADFNTTYDPPIGHRYFADDENGLPGLVLRHMSRTIDLGRVFPDEPERRESILKEV